MREVPGRQGSFKFIQLRRPGSCQPHIGRLHHAMRSPFLFYSFHDIHVTLTFPMVITDSSRLSSLGDNMLPQAQILIFSRPSPTGKPKN